MKWIMKIKEHFWKSSFWSRKLFDGDQVELFKMERKSYKRGFSCSIKHLFNKNSEEKRKLSTKKKLHGTINFHRERSRVSAFSSCLQWEWKKIMVHQSFWLEGKRESRIKKIVRKSIKTSYTVSRSYSKEWRWA